MKLRARRVWSCHVSALAAALLFISLVAPAAGQMTKEEIATQFAAANEAFRTALAREADDPEEAMLLFEQSIAGYESIIERGGIESGKLRYNLGNAYLRAGDVGRAILNYRRAQRLMPDDPNLAMNLAEARSRVLEQIRPGPAHGAAALVAWHTDLGMGVRVGAFALAFGGMWIVGLVRLRRPDRAPWGLAVACGVVWVLALASLVYEEYEQRTVRAAVVVAEEVTGMKGPNAEAYAASFSRPLTAGIEVRIREERGRWLRVALADGRETWVPAASLEAV
jgi:tetratricopeptide (TPR) repeat protein